MRFKALRHQPSDAARKSGYDNEGQLPDTLPDSRSRPGAVAGGIQKQTFNVKVTGTSRQRGRTVQDFQQRRAAPCRNVSELIDLLYRAHFIWLSQECGELVHEFT